MPPTEGISVRGGLVQRLQCKIPQVLGIGRPFLAMIWAQSIGSAVIAISDVRMVSASALAPSTALASAARSSAFTA